jgi:hypothetical protein
VLPSSKPAWAFSQPWCQRWQRFPLPVFQHFSLRAAIWETVSPLPPWRNSRVFENSGFQSSCGLPRERCCRRQRHTHCGIHGVQVREGAKLKRVARSRKARVTPKLEATLITHRRAGTLRETGISGQISGYLRQDRATRRTLLNAPGRKWERGCKDDPAGGALRREIR